MLLFKKKLGIRVLENFMQKKACEKRKMEITTGDLPLCCPAKDERLWDAHPRVYLPIEKSGREVCPYCETEYVLIADKT